MNMIAYRKGYKYQLAEPYKISIPIYNRDVTMPFVTLSRTGLLTIKAGYAWDGPSGPAIDTLNFMRGSLVHDVLYQMIRLGHLDRGARVIADDLLKKICIQDGMSKARAWWVYWAVKTFAQRASMPSSEPPVLRAP